MSSIKIPPGFVPFTPPEYEKNRIAHVRAIVNDMEWTKNRTKHEWKNILLDKAEDSGNVGQFAVIAALVIFADKCAEFDLLIEDMVQNCDVDRFRERIQEIRNSLNVGQVMLAR